MPGLCEQIAEIARVHDAFEEIAISRIFNPTDFVYHRITIKSIEDYFARKVLPHVPDA